MAMATFNTVSITKPDPEINGLKSKMDLMLNVMHLHESHLHHLEEKVEQRNNLLADLLEANTWFSSNVTNAMEKFQSLIHHHVNVVKSAQHHR